MCSQRLPLPLSNMPPSKPGKRFAVSPEQAHTGLGRPRLGIPDFPKIIPAACNSLPVVYFAIHSFIHTKHLLRARSHNSFLMMVLE